ncbi:MAG TPA: MFS transporter [Mycobacteriales bacterium]|nr:MFS transporter [Mycobacteriales bacterium]
MPDTIDVAADLTPTVPDRDRLRRLVPTARQLAAGAELDVAPFEAEFDQRKNVGPGRWDRIKAYLDSVNPFAVDGPKIPVILCSLIGFTIGWFAQAVQIIQPDIQADFGVSITAFAKLGAVFGTIGLIVGIPLGYLVDRVSRVRLLRATIGLDSVGGMLQCFAPSFGTLMVGRAICVAGTMPDAMATFPYLADSYPARSRARVFATYSLASTLGGLVAPPIVGILTTIYGWRAAMFGLVFLSLLGVVLSLFAKEPVRGAMDRRDLGIDEELVEIEEEKPGLAEALKASWGVKSLRLVSIAGFVLSFLSVVQLIDANVQAGKFGLDPFQRSLILSWINGASLVAIGYGGGIADRLLAKRPASLITIQATLAFVSAIGFVGQAFATSLPLYILCSSIPSLSLAAAVPSQRVSQSMVVPSRYRGVGLQIGTPFSLAATLLGPALLSTVTGHGGNLQHVFLYFAPFYVVSGFIYLAAASSFAGDMRAAIAASAARLESEESRRARQNKILVCRDIDVAIEEVQILFRVHLDIKEGEIVALVGTNGAGKSTLLRAICGLQQASNGAIFFDGRDITYLPTHEAAQLGIVYMPGGQGVFPLMSVKDNLLTAARMRKDAADVNVEIEKVLEFFPRLRERLDVQAGTMSGGEQQMLSLGQAFLMKPRLLMIDELSLGLAPAVVEQLLGAIRGMKDEGITVMLVEQSLNVALTVADRAVFMEKGEVAFDGPTEELLARPDLVRSVFLGGATSGGSVASTRRRSAVGEEGNPRLLNCDGLSVAFGGVQVLDDVSVHVGEGEVVGIIGPNGAGKTTLFDLLSGYTRADSGAVQLDDTDITELSPDARARLGLGRAFQNARLFPPLTVRENIAVALEKRANKSPLMGAFWTPGIRRSERKLMTRVDGLVELLGLTAYADKFVRELSTGTRRAVEVACQMAAEPKMLLLDEPSSGLAQAETEALGPALLRIVRETGCGMLVIEHDIPLIAGISDRLVAMELGRVVTTGTPAEVTTDPRVLASYLAASADVIERSGSRVGSVLATIAGEPTTRTTPNRAKQKV